ncbi:SPW repeat protein [Streptomyces noursei]
MSDLSHHATTDITSHPDVAEMRERYARLLSGRQATALDGLVLLAGMYTAISPWVVHFRLASPELAVNNLIIGLVLTVIGLGLTRSPERMYRLSWTCAVIGVWMIISPWVVTAGHRATAGLIWNNVLIGAVTLALGLAATRLAMATGAPRESTT